MRAAGFGAAVFAMALLASASGCASKKAEAPTGFVSADEQYRNAMELLAQDKLTQARTMLEQVAYGTQDERRRLEPLVRLALADATFYQGGELSMIDARNLYLDFVTLNGDHPRAPYAQFQAGVCSLEQISNPAKDQTLTNQTLDDFREVVARYPDSVFGEATQRMLWQAEDYLAEHDYQVGRFYMKKKNYLAATDRFRHILDRYPHFRKMEKVYYYLGVSLFKVDNDAEARIYLDKLITDYPDGERAKDAQEILATQGGFETDVELTP
jgi:outer membrane protein assembly factor BamD